MKGKRTDPAIEAEICRRYREGQRTPQIVAEMPGASQGVVSRVLRRNSIKTLSRARPERFPGFSREELFELYVTGGLATSAIAEQRGTTCATVAAWLRKFDIPVRPRGVICRTERDATPGQLREMYLDRGMTTTEIGAEFGTVATVVRTWLIKSGIPLRKPGEVSPLAYRPPDPDNLLGGKKTAGISREELVELYTHQRLTMSQIGARFGAKGNTVLRWLETYEIPTRRRGEAMVSPEYCLAAVHPNLVADWHSTLNLPITPETIAPGSAKRVHWACRDCGHQWRCILHNRTASGSGCPACAMPKGERAIRDLLVARGVRHKHQAKMKGCALRGASRFDFAVLHENHVVGLIEYHGKQHYEPVELWGGEGTFREQQRRDQVKRDYCGDRGLPLLEIPYWNSDTIIPILANFLDKVIPDGAGPSDEPFCLSSK